MMLFLATMVFVKPSTRAIIEESWHRTLVVGHRGAAAYRPENTLLAFQEGIASKADAVECDVHLSADREIVVIHDATLDRTTSLKGKVAEATFSTMKRAGVPSLAELTNLTKDRTVLIVEIKEGEKVESMVVDHIRKERMEDQSILFSFHCDHLAKVEAIAPELTGVWLLSAADAAKGMPAVFNRLAEIHANGVGFDYRVVTDRWVEEAHRRKLPVFVWTVPPGPEVDRLNEMGVNFIITNHPREVRAQLER